MELKRKLKPKLMNIKTKQLLQDLIADLNYLDHWERGYANSQVAFNAKCKIIAFLEREEVLPDDQEGANPTEPTKTGMKKASLNPKIYLQGL